MTAVSDSRMERIAREVTGASAPVSRWTTRFGTPIREPEDVFSWRSFTDSRGWPTIRGWHAHCGAIAGVEIYVRESGIGGPPGTLFVFNGLVRAQLSRVKDARHIQRTAHGIVKADAIARLHARAARLTAETRP